MKRIILFSMHIIPNKNLHKKHIAKIQETLTCSINVNLMSGEGLKYGFNSIEFTL